MSLVTCKYLHSYGIRLQWSKRKLWQIFSNECHWSHDGLIYIDFFSKIFASRFTRFTDDPFPVISQCKQESVLQSLIEKQVITMFIVTGIVRPTLDFFQFVFVGFSIFSVSFLISFLDFFLFILWNMYFYIINIFHTFYSSIPHLIVYM